MKKALKRIAYSLLLLFLLLNVLAAVQAYHATHYYDRTLADEPKKHIPEMGFGEKLSTVLFGVRVPKSKVVDSLNFFHTNIYLQTSDGLNLAAWYGDGGVEYKFSAVGTVIMFHGHGGCRSGVIKEAEAFHNFGYNVLMVDFRAHGQSDGNTCTIGHEEAKDVKAAYDYVAATHEKNIVLWGVSLGASTIIEAVNDYHIKPAKIILEMPFGTLFDAVKGTMRNNHLPEEPSSVLLTFWGGVEHGFWAFGMKPQDDAKAIGCPVLLQHGQNDVRVTENETQTIYSNIPVSNKTLVEYANCGHESLFKKDSVKWVAAVGAFLRTPQNVGR